MSALDWIEINQLTGEQTGTIDIPCPFCSAGHTARGMRRRVLRIYAEPKWAGWHCTRCAAKGWTRPDAEPGASSSPLPNELAAIRRDADQRASDEKAKSIAKAR